MSFKQWLKEAAGWQGAAILRALDTAEGQRALMEVRNPPRVALDRLTILRMGLGRDSLAMMCLLVESGLLAGGELILPADVDAVVFTDPGNEWKSTYALIPRVREFCQRHGLRFIVQAKPDPSVWKPFLERRQIGQRGGQPWQEDAGGTIEERAARGYYHNRAPILADYASKNTLIAYRDASCTANHKIAPNRALLDDLSMERLGIGNASWSAGVKAGRLQPHRVLLGIAADESDRAIASGGPAYEVNLYPLVEMEISKADEAPILLRHGFNDAHKSGCQACKFAPLGWYWVLMETDPEAFAYVEGYEANAVAHNPNLKGIFPKSGKTLREAVLAWREANPDATVEAVMRKDYKRCDRGGRPGPAASVQS